MSDDKDRVVMTVRADRAIVDAMKRIQTRDGIPVSEQTRRALAAWVEARGETTGKKTGK